MSNSSGVTLPKIAVGAGIAAFFVTIEWSTSSTHNGTVTHCSYRDYGAIVIGAIAVILGLIATLRGKPDEKIGGIGFGVIAILLGVFHVARGFGLILSPC